MRKIILGIILISLFFLVSCSETTNVKMTCPDKAPYYWQSDEMCHDIQEGTQIYVCNSPYILAGDICCLDKNDNQICDKDEKTEKEAIKKTVNEPQEITKPTGSAVFCSDECSADICENSRYIACLKQSDGCKDKVDKGKIIDECGVECLRDSDCDSGEGCKRNKCEEDEEEPVDCTPQTCSGLNYECGTHNNGCGGTLACGSCSLDKYCELGTCVSQPPETGATFTRELPTEVISGQTFTLTYKTIDATGNWGVLIEDDITGGCECSDCSNPTHIATGWLSPATYTEITITAIRPGSCTFNGNYQFASETSYPEVDFPRAIVTVIASSTGGPTMERELPSEVGVGETFDMNLIVTGSTGNYGVLYVTDITGGCTSVAGNTHIAGGFIHTQDTTSTIVMKAPSSAGTCTFTGDYQFADASGTHAEVDFLEQTVIVS